jgi:hypothetical protein
MTDNHAEGRIEEVAPGDVIALDRGAFKVVHKERAESGFVLTLEGDGGETFDLQLPANAPVTRSLEAKWESAQSPTPHAE